MSTSDTEKRTLKTAVIYMAIAILLAVAGAIYELFSHGVYSYYMIYAFMIPLAGGALPYLIRSMRTLISGEISRTEEDEKIPSDHPASHDHAVFKSVFAANELFHSFLDDHAALYHAGIATLTIGSIMKGVLDIYGTTNSLLLVYPVLGAILIIAAAGLSIPQVHRAA